MGMVDRVREFAGEVRVESGKVSWPTRSELRDSTVVVIVTCIIVAIFVGIIDRILTMAVGMLFR
jgi:preprotein translocase subunit SecE